MMHPELFSEGRKPPKGVLLFGNPGNGKTMLAKAIANEVPGLTFMVFSPTSIASKWVGDAEQLVQEMFRYARAHKPCLIFMDEVDLLIPTKADSNSATDSRVLNEILVAIDGFHSNDGVIVLAATNRPYRLSQACLRRFPIRLEVGNPDLQARYDIIHDFLNIQKTTCTTADMKEIAQMCDGFSSSDVSSYLQFSSGLPLNAIITSEYFKKVPTRNRSSYIRQQEMYEPCSVNDDGALKLSLRDIPRGGLVVGPVTKEHLLSGIDNFRLREQEPDIELEEFAEANVLPPVLEDTVSPSADSRSFKEYLLAPARALIDAVSKV